MAFNKNKFTINRNYIRKGNARSGAKINKVRFLVAHDTGNPNSTARGNRSYFHNHQPSASAHTFIDDKEILEIVPINEKAWHVRYNVTKDNQMYGDDANDSAIGTELCYGSKIDFNKAYEKYVWYHAYLCDKFGLNPKTDIVAHATLDPSRRTDPHNALNKYGKTFSQFLNDVEKELKGSTASKPEPARNDGKVQEIPTNVYQIKIKDTPVLRKEGLHTYTKADWNAKKGAPIVRPNQIYTVKRKLKVDGYEMYQLISGWYITASNKYVEVYKTSKDQEKTQKESKKQKFLEIVTHSLHTYNTPNWNDKSGVLVHDGDVYTVKKDKFKVGGGYMYQIKSGLYITANEQYVKPFYR